MVMGNVRIRSAVVTVADNRSLAQIGVTDLKCLRMPADSPFLHRARANAEGFAEASLLGAGASPDRSRDASG